MIDRTTHYLYQITCKDGRRYIGVSIDPVRRLNQHKLGQGCSELKNKKSLKLEILKAGSRDEIYQLEEEYIKSLLPELNKAKGGIGGDGKLVARGEQQGFSKLTENLVIEIRNRVAQGEDYKTLGIEYGVKYPTIHAVCTGKTWKHVGGPIAKIMGLTEQKALKKEKVKNLFALGVLPKDIANDLGIGLTSVYRYLRE